MTLVLTDMIMFFLRLSVAQSAAQARARDRNIRHHDGRGHAAAQPRRPQHLAQLKAALP